MRFSAKCTGLYKTAFSSQDQYVLPFSHWGYHFLAIFSKAREFVQKTVFCPRSARFVILSLGALRFSDFQQSAGVSTKKHVSPTSAHFVIFSPGAPLFCNFQQSAPVSNNTVFFSRVQRFLSCVISTFQCTLKAHSYAEISNRLAIMPLCGFNTQPTHWRVHYRFSATFTRLSKTAFSVRDQHVLSFSRRAY